MKRYFMELVQALVIAAFIALPFFIYFWSMKP